MQGSEILEQSSGNFGFKWLILRKTHNILEDEGAWPASPSTGVRTAIGSSWSSLLRNLLKETVKKRFFVICILYFLMMPVSRFAFFRLLSDFRLLPNWR